VTNYVKNLLLFTLSMVRKYSKLTFIIMMRNLNEWIQHQNKWLKQKHKTIKIVKSNGILTFNRTIIGKFHRSRWHFQHLVYHFCRLAPFHILKNFNWRVAKINFVNALQWQCEAYERESRANKRIELQQLERCQKRWKFKEKLLVFSSFKQCFVF
jgi:hypothetical protein